MSLKKILLYLTSQILKLASRLTQLIDPQECGLLSLKSWISKNLIPSSESFLQSRIHELAPTNNPLPSFGVNIFGYKSSGPRSATALMTDHMRSGFQAANLPFSEADVHHISSIPFRIEKTATSDYCFNLFQINARQMIYLAHLLGRKNLDGHYNIGYWFWELANFPLKWQSVFRCLNEVWTSSEFSRQSIQSLSPIEVKVIPPVIQCVESPLEDKKNSETSDIFTFLFVFDFASYFERKNPAAVIQAFLKAFGSNNKARLVIQCKNTNLNSQQFLLLKSFSRNPNIIIMNENLTLFDARQLIKSCNAYVSLHRSEGFGFTIAEAMYFGKPVITTGYSGNMDFTNETNSYLVKYKLVPILKTVGPYEKGNVWAEPDVNHAAELMVKVRENYSAALQKATAAERDIHEKYNAERIGNMIKNRLSQIYENIQQSSK